MLRSVVLDRHDLIAGWVAARTGYVPGGQFHAIGLLASDGFTQRIIAGVVFDNWRGYDVTGHIACDTTVNRAFLREIHRYPYCDLGVRRITATCRSDNEEAIDFMRRIGFIEEGRIRGGMPDGSDRLILGQLKEHAKWLALR